MSKSSCQLVNDLVVFGVLTDSAGRVPKGNIELNIDDPDQIIGYKYDAAAENSNVKTLSSFTAPSEGKYFDENGKEQDIV